MTKRPTRNIAYLTPGVSLHSTVRVPGSRATAGHVNWMDIDSAYWSLNAELKHELIYYRINYVIA